MGLDNLGINCDIYVVGSDDTNSFMALTDEGFAICLTTGLLQHKAETNDMLKCYAAQSFAHGALRHLTRRFYQEAKDDRKGNLIGGLLAGAAAGLIIADAVTNDNYPYDPYYWPPYIDNKVDVKVEVKMPTNQFCYEYTPDQTYQADLVAYRFMENLGHADDYIECLKVLGSPFDQNFPSETRPGISSRINFLEYAGSHPDIVNKKNKKLREKRLKSYQE